MRTLTRFRTTPRKNAALLPLIVGCLIVATADQTQAAAWGGFLDRSTNLLTSTFSFSGANAVAGDSNENYYDGDMGDSDGDGWMDRALIARYGLLLNTGGGFMTPAGNTIVGGTFRFGDKDGVGNDAAQWADVDNDGNGNFSNVTVARGFSDNFGTNLIVGLVAGDVDNDGDFDLMMINGIQRGITLARNNGSGFFTTNRIPFALAMAPIRPIGSGFSQGMNLGDIDADFTLTFPTATNRNYVVERTTTLSPTAWTELTTLPGNGSVRSVTHTNAGGAQKFYRVRAN